VERVAPSLSKSSVSSDLALTGPEKIHLPGSTLVGCSAISLASRELWQRQPKELTGKEKKIKGEKGGEGGLRSQQKLSSVLPFPLWAPLLKFAVRRSLLFPSDSNTGFAFKSSALK